MNKPKISYCTIRDYDANLHVQTLTGGILTDNIEYAYMWAKTDIERDSDSQIFLIYFNDEWHEAQSIDFEFYDNDLQSKEDAYNCVIDFTDDFSLAPFDGFEVHPVMVIDNAGSCEQCEEQEAHFFTVYAHLKAGGLQALVDCKTKIVAEHVESLFTALISSQTV